MWSLPKSREGTWMIFRKGYKKIFEGVKRDIYIYVPNFKLSLEINVMQ